MIFIDVAKYPSEILKEHFTEIQSYPRVSECVVVSRYGIERFQVYKDSEAHRIDIWSRWDIKKSVVVRGYFSERWGTCYDTRLIPRSDLAFNYEKYKDCEIFKGKEGVNW